MKIPAFALPTKISVYFYLLITFSWINYFSGSIDLFFKKTKLCAYNLWFDLNV